MAQNTYDGLLAELGLSPVNENALAAEWAQQQFEGFRPGGEAGSFMQLGAKLGQGIGLPIAGAVQGYQDKKAGITDKWSMKQGVQSVKEELAAKQQGIDLETYRNRKKMRQEVSSLKPPELPEDASELAQMDAKLEQVAKIAAKYGDYDTLFKVHQKQVALRSTQLEFDNLQARTDQTRMGTLEKYSDMTEMRPIRTADQPNGTGEFASIIADINDPDYGKYRVMGPGGAVRVEERVSFIPEDLIASTGKDRKTAAYWAKYYTGQKKWAGMRDNIDTMAKNSKNASDVAELMLISDDPEGFMAWQGASQQKVDGIIRYIDGITNTLFGATDNYTYKGSTYKDARAQHDAMVKDNVEWLREQGNRVVPESVLKAMRNDAAVYEQWLAITSEQMYVDAKQMEPSNRGLSDSDVERAKDRVGANSQNPLTYVNRQINIAYENLAYMDKMGDWFPDITGPDGETWYSSEDLKAATWNPKQVMQTREQIENSIAMLEKARDYIVQTADPSSDIGNTAEGRGGVTGRSGRNARNQEPLQGSGTADDPFIID